MDSISLMRLKRVSTVSDALFCNSQIRGRNLFAGAALFEAAFAATDSLQVNDSGSLAKGLKLAVTAAAIAAPLILHTLHKTSQTLTCTLNYW